MGDMELQIFADRLKELRQKLNITQKEFAERIGITAAALSSYENNLKNPSIAVAKRIAEAFNVSIDWLCGLSEEKELKPEIQNYKDIAVRILDLLEIGMFPYWFIWDKTKIHGKDAQILMLPDEPTLLKFLETYHDLTKLLNDNKIQRYVIDAWLGGSLEELKKIPIVIPPEELDEEHANILENPPQS